MSTGNYSQYINNICFFSSFLSINLTFLFSDSLFNQRKVGEQKFVYNVDDMLDMKNLSEWIVRAQKTKQKWFRVRNISGFSLAAMKEMKTDAVRRQSYQSRSHSLSVKPTWTYTHITLHKPAQQAQYSTSLFLPKASRLYFTWWNSEVYVNPLGRDWKRAGAMRTGLSMKAGALPRNKGPERSAQLNASTAVLISEVRRCPPRAGETNRRFTTQMPRSHPTARPPRDPGVAHGSPGVTGRDVLSKTSSDYEGMPFILWFLSFFFSMVILDV